MKQCQRRRTARQRRRQQRPSSSEWAAAHIDECIHATKCASTVDFMRLAVILQVAAGTGVALAQGELARVS